MKLSIKIVCISIAAIVGTVATIAVVNHYHAEAAAKTAIEAKTHELAEKKAAADKAAAEANEGEKKAAKFFAPVKTTNFRFDK